MNIGITIDISINPKNSPTNQLIIFIADALARAGLKCFLVTNKRFNPHRRNSGFDIILGNPPWEEATIEEAAAEYKLKCICEKLDLQSHHHLLEIGTGWGGMAIYAAKHYGCKVTTTTISQQQFNEAKNAVRRQGLEDLVTIVRTLA